MDGRFVIVEDKDIDPATPLHANEQVFQENFDKWPAADLHIVSAQCLTFSAKKKACHY
jgi:hypothetical protein